jgi:uncharacterized membrane protein YcgQ (UPF0703/DUF1980 family)
MPDGKHLITTRLMTTKCCADAFLIITRLMTTKCCAKADSKITRLMTTMPHNNQAYDHNDS